MILPRELPQVEFKPKIIDRSRENHELVGYFEWRPPHFMDLPTTSRKDTEATYNDYVWYEGANNYINIHDLCLCKPASDLIQPTNVQLEMKMSKRGDSLATLHFNNPTNSFSTRCDVVYKTMLRDCRKYFADKFGVKKIKRSKMINDLGNQIDDFVTDHFSEYDSHMQKEIKFYIWCLIYPKEILASRIGVFDEDSNVLKGNERSKKVRKIKELHNYLYSFSMEKCEKFFEIIPLRKIFLYYISIISERIALSPTMQKNRDVYMAAINILINNILE